MCGAVLLAAFLDHSPNRLSLAGHGEGSEAGLRVGRILHLVPANTFGKRLGNFLRVARCPDAGAVDAASATVLVNAISHKVEVVLPLIHDIVAQQNLAVARTVHLHLLVATVLLHGLGTAKDHDTTAARHCLGTHVTPTGINAHALPWHAGLCESRKHAVGCPRLLWTWLKHETDLHGNHRHPQRMNTRRIGGQHHSEHR